MRTHPSPAYTAPRSPYSAFSPWLYFVFAVILGTGLFLAGILVALLRYDDQHSGRIYPGVTVSGIDLTGMRPGEAAALLYQRLDYPVRGQIVFQLGDRSWTARPGDLGLYLDSQTSALAAYNLGRSGTPFTRVAEQYQARKNGINLPPVLVYDERVAQEYLKRIAGEVDRPVVEASLAVSGVEVVVTPGQVGKTLDIEAALDKLEIQLRTLTDGMIPMTIDETPPVILDVTEQAEIARRILSAPLVLSIPNAEEGDPGPWTYEPAVLAQMLGIQRVDTPEGARYQVTVNPASLQAFLEGLAPQLQRFPQNARFTFNDDTDQLEPIQPSIVGRTLNIDQTLEQIGQKVAAGEHNIPLEIDYTQPEVADTATTQQLGITQLVSQHTTYFYGSSSSRIHNIQTASARFHGVLVPPGAVFSMVDVLGDVSLDTGYAEALIIYGDRTIQGVGGGVCQVSTTLFRTAFLGGFQIVERYPHAYRVGYYEQTPSGGHDTKLAGLDATVFAPVVDFKFRNDSQNWLLMETYVNPSSYSLTWKFYSTSDGRTVEWQSTGPQNIVDPPDPLYEENAELSQGQIKQVDYAAKGADVTVTRTVWRDGQALYEDTIRTHYLPWRAVYQYGPGTEIPDQEDDEEASN